MTDDINLTHDTAVSAFDSASGAITTDDDGVHFSWDEENVVRVDAPSDLTGAFDTDRFYKIEGATVARPIKQPYMVGDEIKWYKKPAEELRKAAWSFDNAPYPIPHPDTGMVKDVNDIHGFWRNVRYDEDDERLLADLYVPENDDYALDFIEEHQDVSPGFYNRVVEEYDGDTGDLTDDDVDGFQVDMYGDHIAGVERGRCSGADGCGLDDQEHGTILDTNDVSMTKLEHDRDYVIAPPTEDYEEDGTYYAVAPDENPDGEPKYPINSCSDVQDAWHLRGHGDLDISQSTLEDRIKSKARDLDCDVPAEESSDSQDCGCGPQEQETTMSDEDTDTTNDSESFDVPDLSVDAVAEKNDAVAQVVEERDSLREDLDEAESTIEEALDAAENFSVELEEDECACEAVADLVEDFDSTVEEVEDLREEITEYREDEIEEKLDRLDELGADRDEWSETADEAEDPIGELDEEIQRREEVLDAAPETSVKDIEGTEDSADDEQESTYGSREFGRGYGA